MENINMFIARNDISVLEAMKRIDDNRRGILFLVNENDALTSCITDGDIRRFLISGGKINESVYNAANHAPKYAKSEEEAKLLYQKQNYVVIPIIDNYNNIIDLYSEYGVICIKHNPINTPVVINAGGKGTRLDPFTRVIPKPLIPIGEMPIIEHIMKKYQEYACNEFHVIVNYKKELIKAYFSVNNEYDIHWYDEEKPLGTGGGLALLKGRFKETVFFTNCDSLLTANYESMINFHKENCNAITMICAYKHLDVPYGVVDMGVNGMIKSFKEKPSVSFLTNTGIYIVEPEVIEDIKDDVSIGFPDIIEMEREKGKKVAVFPVSENSWMDMGQFPELEKMRIKLYGE